MADISKARALLEYEPKVALEEGLLDYIRYALILLKKAVERSPGDLDTNV